MKLQDIKQLTREIFGGLLTVALFVAAMFVVAVLVYALVTAISCGCGGCLPGA